MSGSGRQAKSSDLQSPLGQLQTGGKPFLFNAWYIAAESLELKGGAIVGRTLLGKRIAVYRGETGPLVAMDDFCPDRMGSPSLSAMLGVGFCGALRRGAVGAGG